MNKELIIENVKKKFDGELLDIVIKQIDDYFELANSDYVIENKYNVNDQVMLNKNHLLHGIGKHTDIINLFSARGVVSQDYLEKLSDHAFNFVASFWNVKGDISLKEYIENYSGVVAKVNDEYWQVPYRKIDEFVEIMRDVDHWKWTAESSMEIRFMPSLARDINQVGFILNTENEIAQKLRKNSVFQNDFKNEYALEFVSEKSKDKFANNGFIDDFFERADYLIFGLPKNCIEGIVVGKNAESDKSYLNFLKSLFPTCYICNLDGIVIK